MSGLQRPLVPRFRFRQQLKASVICYCPKWAERREYHEKHEQNDYQEGDKK
jgi:hypothetical protein